MSNCSTRAFAIPDCTPPFVRKNSPQTVSAVIETKDVSVVAKCPNCGVEMREEIGSFVETDLWYGQESICCPECDQTFRIDFVERDC